MAEHAYIFQLAQVCKSWRRLALSGTSLREDITVVCPSCDAVHFPGERNSTSTNSNPHFSNCCADGKVGLAPLRLAPAMTTKLWQSCSHGSLRCDAPAVQTSCTTTV